MDEKDVIELYTKQETADLEELNRLSFDDPKRNVIMKELELFARNKSNYQTNEQTRLNNNAQNDINEAKLIIEQQKLENEKRKVGVSIGQAIAYPVISLGFGYLSYHMEETKQVFRDVKSFGVDIIKKFIPVFWNK